MNKSILLLGFLFSWSLAQAAPVEDEPLPFDTKMPPRVVQQQAGEPDPAPAVITRATPACKTVVKKVHGRKVRQEVCGKSAAAKSETAQSKKTVKGKKEKVSKATIAKKSSTKSKSNNKKNKRR